MVAISPDTAGAAVALRLAGASYTEIAGALDLPKAHTARLAVEKGLALQPVNEDDRNMLRQEEAGRLERLLRSVWTKAVTPTDSEHLPAVKVALALVDRHARLLGLDAPQEIIVHSPTTREIDAFVAAILSNPHLGVEESVVVDAEIVE